MEIDQKYRNGIIMVMARIKLSEGQFFPLETKETPRYTVSIALTILFEDQANIFHYENLDKNVIAGSEQNLLNKIEWK